MEKFVSIFLYVVDRYLKVPLIIFVAALFFVFASYLVCDYKRLSY